MPKYQRPIFLIAVLLTVTCLAYTNKGPQQPQKPPAVEIVAPETPIPETPPEIKPEPPKPIEPEWTNYPAIRGRQNGLGEVLSDIESHMPAGHIYRDNDKVTWAHETSHGLASNIRQKFGRSGRINGFYCLKDRACVIKEPPTTIQRTAQVIPRSLRGGVYQLYMIQQASSWGDTPLYICDEWMGYSNGTHAGIDLAEKGQWTAGRRLGTVRYMMEFNVYTIAMLSTVPQHQDEQLKKFVQWNLERTVDLLSKSKLHDAFTDPSAETYWKTFQTGVEGEPLRVFARSYFGTEWCLRVLGF